MHKFLIGIGLATLVSAPVLAQSGPAPKPAHGKAAVTRAEVQSRLQQRFAAIDANHDGAITRAEMDAKRDAMRQQWQAKRAERRGERFAALDTDRNGALSQQEFAAGHVRGKAGEGKGRARAHHRMQGRGHAMAMGGARWLERADTNKDGKVTLAEASAQRLAAFDRVDADKNGTVTPEERRAARQAWHARRG